MLRVEYINNECISTLPNGRGDSYSTSLKDHGLRDAQGGIGDEDYCKAGLINMGDGEIGLNLSLSTFASCSTYDDGFRP
jgi:hypothetical protein